MSESIKHQLENANEKGLICDSVYIEKQRHILGLPEKGTSNDLSSIYSNIDKGCWMIPSSQNIALFQASTTIELVCQIGDLTVKNMPLLVSSTPELQPTSLSVGAFRVAQDTDEDAAFVTVRVQSPGGYFQGDLLLDTGCSIELNFSEGKAHQIGLRDVLDRNTCELGDCSSSGITLR